MLARSAILTFPLRDGDRAALWRTDRWRALGRAVERRHRTAQESALIAPAPAPVRDPAEPEDPASRLLTGARGDSHVVNAICALATWIAAFVEVRAVDAREDRDMAVGRLARRTLAWQSNAGGAQFEIAALGDELAELVAAPSGLETRRVADVVRTLEETVHGAASDEAAIPLSSTLSDDAVVSEFAFAAVVALKILLRAQSRAFGLFDRIRNRIPAEHADDLARCPPAVLQTALRQAVPRLPWDALHGLLALLHGASAGVAISLPSSSAVTTAGAGHTADPDSTGRSATPLVPLVRADLVHELAAALGTHLFGPIPATTTQLMTAAGAVEEEDDELDGADGADSGPSESKSEGGRLRRVSLSSRSPGRGGQARVRTEVVERLSLSVALINGFTAIFGASDALSHFDDLAPSSSSSSSTSSAASSFASPLARVSFAADAAGSSAVPASREGRTAGGGGGGGGGNGGSIGSRSAFSKGSPPATTGGVAVESRSGGGPLAPPMLGGAGRVEGSAKPTTKENTPEEDEEVPASPLLREVRKFSRDSLRPARKSSNASERSRTDSLE